jgi:hypothetical protein
MDSGAGGRIRCGVTAWDAAFLRQDKLKHTVTKIKGANTVKVVAPF